MKILHTSDWHLGQKFVSREREEEHQLALDWLATTIAEQGVEALIVAGDVFDIGNPPHHARAMYYGFLRKLRFTGCRHIVITGGNHDSPQMLNAPRELLQLLDMHVVGCASEDVCDEIIVLKNQAGEPECIVAAVPFLRDQDLRRAISGETGQERIERIKEGIFKHYQAAAEAVGKVWQQLSGKKKKLNVPVIATGHLYASWALASEKQENIYLGNLENIRAEQFQDVFDYVALGHIHRAQALGGLAHVRYSGSLIPLSFSETKDDKVVVLLDFDGKKLKEIKELPVPVFRRLKTIDGRLAEVQERLEAFDDRHKEGLPPWVETIVESDTIVPNLHGLLLDFTKDMHLELLRSKLNYTHRSLNEQVEETIELDELEPMEVFLKRCESAGR
ncbi:MAG: exonuclease SbcCD subunit D C-terminal domain-containing protein, partial [Bacteroidota bacterium]